jgi:hypothetical protein
MRQPHRAARKKFDYPGKPSSSRLAGKARKLASKLTPEDRRKHFNAALIILKSA